MLCIRNTSCGHVPSPQPSHLDISVHNMPKLCTFWQYQGGESMWKAWKPWTPWAQEWQSQPASQKLCGFSRASIMRLLTYLKLSYLPCLNTLWVLHQAIANSCTPSTTGFEAPLLRCLQRGRKGQKACHPLHVKNHLRSEKTQLFRHKSYIINMFTSLGTQFADKTHGTSSLTIDRIGLQKPW